MAKTSVKAAQPLDDEYGLKRGRRKCIPTASHLPVPIPFGVRLNGGLRSSIKTTTAAAKSQSNSEPADSSPSQNKDVSLLEVSDTVSYSQLVKCSSPTESKDVSVSHSQLVKCSTSTAADADASVKTAKARRKRGTTLGGARKKRTCTIWRKRKKEKKKKKSQ